MKKLILFLFFALCLNAQDFLYEQGKSIYKATCISCHGAGGEVDETMKLIIMPRNLTKSILNKDQTYTMIKDGTFAWGAHGDIMPSFASLLNENELAAVTYYVSKAFNPRSEKRVAQLYASSDKITEDKKPLMLKRGAKIYKKNCSWCHGVTGDGDGKAHRNRKLIVYPYNLQKTILTQEQIFLFMKYGGKYWGSHKNDMPAWSVKYDDFTLKSVAKYIQTKIKRNQ